MKKKIKLKLAHRISLLVVILVVVSVSCGILAAGYWNIKNMLAEMERNVLNVVKITALSPVVIDGLENPEQENNIQGFIERTQSFSDEIDVMVVADKNGIRYGHTKEDRLGKLFSAEDHMDAITKGETYVSTGPGTLGPSMRAYAPIIGENDDILGFVMAGSLLDNLQKAKIDNIKIMVSFLFFGVTLGIIGAAYVSRKIKRSLLNYEPEDIARLYLENKGILSTIHEGIITVNKQNVITLINQRCIDLLHIHQKDVLGYKILDVFPQSRLPEVVNTGEQVLDYQMALGDIVVVSNNIPLVSKGSVVGGVSSFRDQTEVARMAEQITGVNKIVDSLRATTHEFKNKLHVILGFIEADKKLEAKNYIAEVNENIQISVSHILNLIKDPTIAALLIGKVNRGNELGIKLELSENSYFDNSRKLDINGLVVILGNLIDNAMDNLDSINKENKLINVTIFDNLEMLSFVVEDNGTGIKDTNIIFKKGFTTKNGSRGYGLALVKENTEKYNGTIYLETYPNEGTKFIVEI